VATIVGRQGVILTTEGGACVAWTGADDVRITYPSGQTVMDHSVSRQTLLALPKDHPYRAVGDGSYVPRCVTNREAWALAEPLIVELLAHDERQGAANSRGRRTIVSQWVYALAVDDPDLLTVEFALDDFEIARLLPTYLNKGALRTSWSVLRGLRDGFSTVFAKAPVLSGFETTLPPVTDEQATIALEACSGLRQPAEANAQALIHLTAGAGLDGPDLRHAAGRHVERRASGIWVTVDWGMHPREIPVRDRHAEPLAALADARGDLLLIASTTAPCHMSAAGGVAKKINARVERVRGGFTVSPQRLRKNWLAAMIHQGMPYDVLMRIAGMDSLRAVETMIRHHLTPTALSDEQLARYCQ